MDRSILKVRLLRLIVGTAATFTMCGTTLHADDVPAGIVGGYYAYIGGSTGYVYAAQISPNGTVTQPSLTGVPGSAIASVAINNGGVCLVGGYFSPVSTIAYAALVAPDGEVTRLFPMADATLRSVAINDVGVGLIGGQNSNAAYAALVAPGGAVTPLILSGAPGSVINSVAINNTGTGLIGGQNSGSAYAAPVVTGSALPPFTLPGPDSNINSVAINNAGVGLVGGYYNTSYAYAAFAGPGSTVAQLSLTTETTSRINSVAINNAGVGLVGGQYNTSYAYAALALPDNTVIQLTLTAEGNSQINSVAINDAGVGLVGGYYDKVDEYSGYAYSAIIAPDGAVTPLTLQGALGSAIKSVAINNAGVGLIGGYSNGREIAAGCSYAYAALVAPSGAVTQIPLTGVPGSQINSVALASTAIPSSTGPYASAMYTQLAAAAALEMRFTSRYVFMNTSPTELADASDDEQWLARAARPSANAVTSCKQPDNCIWFAPFGNYVHIAAQDGIPTYTNTIGGVLLAYDRRVGQFLVGGSIGYAFNDLHYSQKLGHGNLQEEMLSAYMAYEQRHLRINAAAWGGFYQFHNTRHSAPVVGFSVTSKAHADGWIFSPHVEVASPWSMAKGCKYVVEPFVMFDWVNSWQARYTETGSVGLNLVMPSQYASLLQSEVGLRFYERFQYNWGQFLLQEKVSYVNQAPFHFQKVTTLFAGGFSTFPVATGTAQAQNLGGLELYGSFLPSNRVYPYGGIMLQALLGSSYQSYFVSVDLGKEF